MKLVTPPRTVAVLLLTGFAVLSMACGAVGRVREAADRQARSNDLKQIALSYISYCDVNRKGPANIDELVNLQPEIAPVAQKVKNGQYVVPWNVNMANMTQFTEGTSNTVLAYESAVPTAGGLVVMCDGFVKNMTAAEFNAAPKAGDKSDKKAK